MNYWDPWSEMREIETVPCRSCGTLTMMVGTQLCDRCWGFERAVSDLIRQHNLATEQLTTSQLADAIRQALASGDFIRHVRTDGAQAVVYVPYAEVEKLRAKIATLETALTVGVCECCGILDVPCVVRKNGCRVCVDCNKDLNARGSELNPGWVDAGNAAGEGELCDCSIYESCQRCKNNT